MKTPRFLIGLMLIVVLANSSGCGISELVSSPSPPPAEPGPSSIVSAETLFAPYLDVPEKAAVMDNGRKDSLDDLVWEFNWHPQRGATRYHLVVRHQYDLNIAIDDDALTTCQYTYASRGYVPPGNDRNWTWKVRAMYDGEWSPWSEVRTFDVEPVDTDASMFPPAMNPSPEPEIYTVNVSVYPNASAGKVVLSPPGGTYEAGSYVTVKVEANSGYRFVTWSGDLGGPMLTIQFVVGSDMTINAHFVSGDWQ